MQLELSVLGADGKCLARAQSADEAFLVYRQEYREGDHLLVSASEPGHIWLALDDAMPAALTFLAGESYGLQIPWGAARKTYSPRAFSGQMHRLWARAARPEEIAQRRDLALNPWDSHANTNTTLFPHASANVETRGEAVFAARNAIDGEVANDDHGFWPYTSWGINQDPDAALTLDFGRDVLVDEIALTLRADFPHDAWWEAATVTFSDGSSEALSLVKSASAQRFPIARRTIASLRLHSLIKADDPSPFPALTRIEVFGKG